MTDHDVLALPFTAIRATDLPRVGGKGANLGELTHAGFPVPPGFCLTTTAFRHFVAQTADPDGLYARLDSVGPGDVAAAREVGRHVRTTLEKQPVPDAVASVLRTHVQHLDPALGVAVRSSATAEDLPDASFAGQQDSYLNVHGEAALLEAVRRCWLSLFTDRAILYRVQNGFSHRDVQLSVVVQQMVAAESAGILFTADPLTGHRQTISIDASFGLGEALVGGLVSPDAYRVDKRSRTILERRVADKTLAIVPEAGGGTRQQTLAGAQRGRRVLTDPQILALADLGSRVEAHYGVPQDIEWAIDGGELYLLQARPITSLFPIDGLPRNEDGLHIYYSIGHQQMMTRAMSPLSLSTFRTLIPVGHADGRIESTVALTTGGRLYVDLTAALRHPLLHRPLLAVTSQFDPLAPQTFRQAMARPEFQRPHGLSIPFALLPHALRLVGNVVAALWWRDLRGAADWVNDLMGERVAEVERALGDRPAGRDQIPHMLATLRTLFPVILRWVPLFIAGEAARRLLARFGRGWADPDDLEAYSLGLRGNAVTEMTLALGDLAEIARGAPALVAHFAHLTDESHEWLTGAAALEGAAPFMTALEAFLEAYGARGPSEIDIAMPRWYEEPLPLLHVIAAHLEREPGSHRAHLQRQTEAREAAVDRLLRDARRGPLGPLRVRLVRRLIHAVHHGSVLREHHKFLIIQHLRSVKERLKETAAHLVTTGKLAAPDEIWLLTWPDLLTIWDEAPDEIQSRIAKRRADLRRYEKLTPPLILTSDGESPVAHYERADAPPGALLGFPVAPGVIEGTVRVLRDPQAETLHPGEILVAPFTDPGWTPLFINAGGLILEVGGVMSHGAVVAREYGIPAVVGVKGATTTLRSGQRVRIDGNRGIIEVLEITNPIDNEPRADHGNAATRSTR